MPEKQFRNRPLAFTIVTSTRRTERFENATTLVASPLRLSDTGTRRTRPFLAVTISTARDPRAVGARFRRTRSFQLAAERFRGDQRRRGAGQVVERHRAGRAPAGA